MAHDVFLSYSYQDKAAADGICHSLEAQGVRCWIAPRDVIPGADWQQSIMEAITASKAVILIFTAHTNQSENVRKEISAAVDAGAVVIPFFIEDVKPEGSLKFHLIGVHWLDAYAPPLEEHIAQLATTIFGLSGHAPPEPRPVPPPVVDPAPHVTPAPPPPPSNDLSAMWARMSRDRKIAVAAVAALVVVSLIAVFTHMPKPAANASNSSSSSASSSAPSGASTSSASSSNSAAVAATDEGANTGTPDRHVQVINETEHAMLHFYASNIDRTSWEEDILGTSVLAPGESSSINIDDGTGHCLFDFKAVFDDNQSLIRHAVDVCKTRVYRYTEN